MSNDYEDDNWSEEEDVDYEKQERARKSRTFSLTARRRIEDIQERRRMRELLGDESWDY